MIMFSPNQYHEGFKLRRTSLIEFFLVPFTATCLIAQDLLLSPEEAYSVMRTRSKTGKLLYMCRDGDANDVECDEILLAARAEIKASCQTKIVIKIPPQVVVICMFITIIFSVKYGYFPLFDTICCCLPNTLFWYTFFLREPQSLYLKD